MDFQNLSILNTSQNKQGLSRALPIPAHLMETFCPSAILWKMFPEPKTASPEQGHRPSHRASSCEGGKGSLPVFAEEPGLASKARRGCPTKLPPLPPGHVAH